MIALPETNGKGAQTFIKRIEYAIENPIIDDDFKLCTLN
ncbi:MAG: hypothetical protein DRP19_04965 [Thermotogae bacterium]|nr:MAG: hypothetical protein DRP19_04965 [Thermotogota bacterium]